VIDIIDKKGYIYEGRKGEEVKEIGLSED